MNEVCQGEILLHYAEESSTQSLVSFEEIEREGHAVEAEVERIRIGTGTIACLGPWSQKLPKSLIEDLAACGPPDTEMGPGISLDGMWDFSSSLAHSPATLLLFPNIHAPSKAENRLPALGKSGWPGSGVRAWHKTHFPDLPHPPLVAPPGTVH